MKGICFTEPLFPKVIEGTKTQTRRVIPMQPSEGESYENIGQGEFAYLSRGGMSGSYFPRYKLGETVYLKEPYLYADDEEEQCSRPYYKFSTADILQLKVMGADNKWENKLFMPESAARYFIKITGVRAERLQDITNVDCRKEGVNICNGCIERGCHMGEVCAYPSAEYKDLINSIHGKGTWEKNPWVWVYDFELTTKQ